MNKHTLLSLASIPLDKRDSTSLECILKMCVNLVSFDYVVTILQSIMYIKKNPLHFRMYKKKCGREHCLKEELWAMLPHQRVSTEFRQLLLIISSPRK